MLHENELVYVSSGAPPPAGGANSVHAVVFFIANWTQRCGHFCITPYASQSKVSTGA